MSKILYLDCGMGAAGDMLAAALFDLLGEEKQREFLSQMAAAGIPHTDISAERVTKSGIGGIRFRVRIDGAEEHAEDVRGHGHGHEEGHDHGHVHGHEEGHDHGHVHGHEGGHDHGHEHAHDHEHVHDHGHDHGHGHHHEHHSMQEIRGIIASLALPEKVKEDIAAVYDEIASAESRVHGVPVSEIHLHEVGMLDAIADIASVCLLVHKLSPDRIVASPLVTGYGAVRCAHGILPVPAPATALILRGVPSCAGDIEGELCTPTGAALVKHFATAYGTSPVMTPTGTGYGMGTKEFVRLNCVRATIGWADGSADSGTRDTVCTPADSGPEDADCTPTDTIVELACNLDDMTGEEIGFAAEELLAGKAVDVWTAAVQMKKNRPGTILTVLCHEGDRDEVVRQIFRLTTTIGIRETLHRRYTLARHMEEDGSVRRKVCSGYGVTRSKAEYEDLAARARAKGTSLRER